MANDNNGGGITTTVKTEVSSDLDLQKALKEGDYKEDDKTDDEDEDAGDPKPEAKAKDDDPMQRELNRLNKELRLEKRSTKNVTAAVRELQDEIARLKDVQQTGNRGSGPAREDPRPSRPVLDPDDYPNAKDFEKARAKAEETYEDSLEAWRERKRGATSIREQQALERARVRSEADAVTIDTFNDGVVEFKKTHADYEAVMTDSDVELSQIMFGAMLEEGPALGYYFATHREESEKIAAIADPKKALKAIMRIIVKLEGEDLAPRGEAKVPSAPGRKPPEPPKPLRGGGAPPVKTAAEKTFKQKEQEAYEKGELKYKP